MEGDPQAPIFNRRPAAFFNARIAPPESGRTGSHWPHLRHLARRPSPRGTISMGRGARNSRRSASLGTSARSSVDGPHLCENASGSPAGGDHPDGLDTELSWRTSENQPPQGAFRRPPPSTHSGG